MGNELSCTRNSSDAEQEIDYSNIDQSNAASIIQNQFRIKHSNNKVTPLLREHILNREHNIKVISIYEFNSHISPTITEVIQQLQNYDLTTPSNTRKYTIDCVRINENEFYKGQWNIHCQKHGIGIYIYPNGVVYYGNYINDTQEGKGILIQPDGSYYKGNFMNGLANGEGTLYVKNEYTYTGEWKDNAKTGRGCEQYHITGDVYEGEFVNNEKEGKGKYTYKDGTVYEGGFANSRYDGRGKMTWTDGRKYIGEFRKGRIEGKGKMLFKTGLKYEGEYENGIKNGYGVLSLEKGKGASVKGFWKNNKLHGKVSIVSDENVLLCEFLYRFGKVINIIYQKDSPNIITNEETNSELTQKIMNIGLILE